jgi:HlyD family secretion protein
VGAPAVPLSSGFAGLKTAKLHHRRFFVSSVGAFFKRNLVWSLAIVAAVIGAGSLLAWRAGSHKPKYVTAVVTRGRIERSVSTTGALNPVVTVQVGSYVSGTVKSLSCDFNTEVVVGQKCALIDPVPFQLIVDQDRAQVVNAEAQLRKDQASLVYAKIAYERDKPLVAEGTVAQDTVDSEHSTYDQAVAQIGLDQASIQDKKAALKAAQVNLDYTEIVSPVVGTVITRSIDVGQTVAASLQSPTLFLIGKDLTHMQVDTNVSEADVGDIRLGQDSYFTVQAFPGQTFHGKVWQIRRGPITVQNVVTYDVVVAFDNLDRKLFPGMTADTHIVIEGRDDVLRVPIPAVRFNPEGLSALKSETPSAGATPPADTTPAEGERHARNRPEGERTPRPHGDGEQRAWNRSGGGPGGGGHGGGEGHGGRRRSNQSQVWVLDADNNLKPVKVTTGIDDGALIEVSGEGLKAGDRVVVNQVDANNRRGANPGLRPPGSTTGFGGPGGGGPPGPGPRL